MWHILCSTRSGSRSSTGQESGEKREPCCLKIDLPLILVLSLQLLSFSTLSSLPHLLNYSQHAVRDLYPLKCLENALALKSLFSYPSVGAPWASVAAACPTVQHAGSSGGPYHGELELVLFTSVCFPACSPECVFAEWGSEQGHVVCLGCRGGVRKGAGRQNWLLLLLWWEESPTPPVRCWGIMMVKGDWCGCHPSRVLPELMSWHGIGVHLSPHPLRHIGADRLLFSRSSGRVSFLKKSHRNGVCSVFAQKHTPVPVPQVRQRWIPHPRLIGKRNSVQLSSLKEPWTC